MMRPLWIGQKTPWLPLPLSTMPTTMYYIAFFWVILTCKDDATNGNGLCRSARLWSVWDRKPDSSNFTRLQQHGNNRTIAISNPSEYGFTLWYRRHYVSVAWRALILESDLLWTMCLSGPGEKSDFPPTASTTPRLVPNPNSQKVLQ